MTQTNCPKCRTQHLRPTASGATTLVCPGCHGLWQPAGAAFAPEALHPSIAGPPHHKPTDGDDPDLRTGLCPEGHGILIRAHIDLDPPFWLERCSACGGVWFDHGEWNRIAEAHLLDLLPNLFSVPAQRRARKQGEHERYLARVEENLGPELYERLRSTARALREVGNRPDAWAFLRYEAYREE